MRVNEQWLREWVDPEVSTEQIATTLTMAGLEVDSVEPVASVFSGVCVGQIKEIVQHPNADRLRCCKVDIGSGKLLEIVCGGANVRVDQKVPVAVVGADLGAGFVIKKSKLRGEPSHGMICSSQELGLGDDGSGGIMELSVHAPIGTDIRQYLALDDTVFDIDLTPNRGDCLSVRGVAREVAVFHDVPFAVVTQHAILASCEDMVDITVKSTACPRYVGRFIRQINPAASIPVWMVERLRRAGVRSIHPVVDILHYVMLELGQPMHAFDLAKLNGGVIVRSAKKGESIVLLDEKEVKLDANDLVIADSGSAIAIAGVMGGLASSVTDTTVNILLESAYFEPIALAKTARRLGLQTDACYRFARGVDYQRQTEAIERATQLLLEYVGGSAGPVIERCNEEQLPKRASIALRYARIERILGVSIEGDMVVKYLEALGMTVEVMEEGWTVTAPSFRSDIQLEIDLIEEVARLYRFDQIPLHTQAVSLAFPAIAETDITPIAIKQTLMHLGYHEIITYSFIDSQLAQHFSAAKVLVELANPLSNDMNTMRGSLWPGMITTMLYNQHRQCPRQLLFEMGKCFVQAKKEVEQVEHLGMLLTGSRYPEQWGRPGDLVDYYDLKAHVAALLQLTGNKDAYSWRSENHMALQPGQSSALYEGEQCVGFLGALHPSLAQQLGVNGPVYLFEAVLATLSTAKIPVVEAVSKFPAVRRDLAFLFDCNVVSDNIIEVIRETAGSILSSVKIFDVYEGVECGLGKKSIALGLTFQAASRTLVDEEINQVIDSIMKALQQAFNATLRV